MDVKKLARLRNRVAQLADRAWVDFIPPVTITEECRCRHARHPLNGCDREGCECTAYDPVWIFQEARMVATSG